MFEICGDGFVGKGLASCFENESIEYRFSVPEVKYANGTLDESLIKQYNDKDVKVFINVAGPSIVSDSFEKEKLYTQSPICQLRAHLDFLGKLRKPPHYIFLSSASVYGDCSSALAIETQELRPASPYAIGKALSEKFLVDCGYIYPNNISVLRATSIYSNDLQTRIFGRIRDQIFEKNRIELSGSGQEIRDFLHISDFFAAIMVIIDKSKNNITDVLNVGSGEGVKISELANIAVEVSKTSLDILVPILFTNQSRLGDPHTMAVSLDKLIGLGWRPQVDTRESLRAFFQKNLKFVEKLLCHEQNLSG